MHTYRCATGSRLVSLAFKLITSVCAVLLPLGMNAANADELAPSYCYAGRCYTTLHGAEADLRRSAGPYGSLWRKEKTYLSMKSVSGDVYSIQYKVHDQEPSVLYQVGYRIGSRDSRDGICRAAQDPYDAPLCANESEGVEGLMAWYRADAGNCTYVDIGYKGEHASPYATVRRTYGYGTIGFLASQAGAEKGYMYSVWCPGWGTPEPSVREANIYKVQHFECAAGFQPKNVNNPVYLGGNDKLIWPRVCEPTMSDQVITLKNPTQTSSNECTKNPCFPATGDKARSEVDFTFAGRNFTRYYHSLGQMQIGPDMGANWSHSYAGAIVSSDGYGRITEKGYLQTYSNQRGKQSVGESFRKLSNGEFELIESSGSTRRYNSQGQLVASMDGDPRTSVVLTYDPHGRIEQVKDSVGRVLRFNYSGSRIESIVLPDGTAATYSYDEYNNLVGVTRPDGSTRTYLYSETGLAPEGPTNLLTGIVEQGVRYGRFSYGIDERVTGSRLIAAENDVDSVSISYNADGSAILVGNLGDVRQLSIGGKQYRQVTQSIDATGTRSYGFTSDGAPSYRIDARGHRTTYTYTNSPSATVSQVMTVTEEAIGRVTRTTRDANNRVVEERVSQTVAGVEQLASLDRMVPDAQGRSLFTCRYDTTQSTDYVCGSQPTAPANIRQTANLYCTDADVAASPAICPFPGLQRSTRDPAGNLTQFEYYAANDSGCDTGGTCTHRKGDLRAQINALGQRTEFLEYDAAGNVIRIQGIDGTEAERLYDPMGRMVTETLKGATPADDRISLFEYSSTGKLTRTTAPDGVWTRMHYDTADRLTSVEDALGNRIVYTLDGAGNRTREEVQDTSGTLRRVLNRTFDTASRNTSVAGFEGHATLMRYDGNGNVLETEDAHGIIAKQTYDGADRILTAIQDKNGIAAKVGYEYTANGQIAAITDPKGLRTTYGYNGFGDQISLVSPDTGTTSFTVDVAGNRKSKTDARGITATYQYDAGNRLTSIAYPDPSLDVGYVYDVAPAVCTAEERFAAGRLGTAHHAGGSTAYCYDRFGHLTRKVQTVNGVVSTVRYGYTTGGRLAQLTYPDGSVADYVRDSLGRISGVNVTRPGQSRQVVISQVSYAPFGPATSWTYGNGRILQRPVDQDYRASAIEDTAPGGLSLGFGYNEVGAITELTNGAGTATLAKYGYDGLGRLTQTQDGVTGTAIETYSYDATGNRTTLTTSAGATPYTYAANSNRLTSVGEEARAYDAAGNTLGVGEREFAYSDNNRMSVVRQAGAITERYAYNHRGERIERTPAANDAEFAVFNEAGQWLGNYGSAGQAQQQVIWLDGHPIAVMGAPGAGRPELAFVESDHLGTPRAVIDPVRDIAIWEWSSKSEVFGNQVPSADPDGDGIAYDLAMRFAGQQATDASGLVYNAHRDYDPSAGRYVQSDPIGLSGGTSTYGYVSGNPLSNVDPFGLADRQLGDHKSGRWIDCGKGCRIRIDFNLDMKTGQLIRHLHWECRDGREGECGENGEKSHGSSWEDAPRHIRDCALKNGFAGAPAPQPVPPPSRFDGMEQTPGSKAATMGGAFIMIGAFLLWVFGG